MVIFTGRPQFDGCDNSIPHCQPQERSTGIQVCVYGGVEQNPVAQWYNHCHVADTKSPPHRQCGYNPDYLKESADKGSQKLLHWTAEDLVNWIRSIELDDYVEGFENMGIHGAVMVSGIPVFLW